MPAQPQEEVPTSLPSRRGAIPKVPSLCSSCAPRTAELTRGSLPAPRQGRIVSEKALKHSRALAVTCPGAQPRLGKVRSQCHRTGGGFLPDPKAACGPVVPRRWEISSRDESCCLLFPIISFTLLVGTAPMWTSKEVKEQIRRVEIPVCHNSPATPGNNRKKENDSEEATICPCADFLLHSCIQNIISGCQQL